jgi:hypothetical protein
MHFILTFYCVSKKGLPREAGTTLLFLEILLDIMVNAIIVAKYGIIERI